MSRIRNGITFTAGAVAGLFLAALASSATATADTGTPTIPGLPGLVEQVITSPASIPQQLLQTTTAALTGAPMTPATPPIASATVSLPQAPAALAPTGGTAAGLPAMPGLPVPTNLTSVLPFPMPNFGGTTASIAAPSATLPGAFLPSAPAVVPSQPSSGSLPIISGLP
jgi:hypothetical protein